MTDPARPDQIPVTAAVLAGKRSSRTGAGEGPLSRDEAAKVCRAAEVAASVCERVMVITDRPEMFADSCLPSEVRLLDEGSAGAGGLGALVKALSVSEDDWVLLVSPDAELRPELLRRLWSMRGDSQAVVTVREGGEEPLLALYRKDCLPVAEETIRSGRSRIAAILRSLKVAKVPLYELPGDDADANGAEDAATQGAEDAATQGGPKEPSEHEASGAHGQARPTVVMAASDRHGGRLPVERPITVFMNDVEIATIQGSPSQLEEMALGFLLAEGLVSDREKLKYVDVDSKRGLVYVSYGDEVPDEFTYKKRYITSGCGKGVTFSSVGHARGLDAVISDMRVSPADLLSMVLQLSNEGMDRKDTGGVHGCGFGRDGRLFLIREDIGRHNAVDKLLGRAWLDRIPTNDLVLVSTGRISYEMTVKAAKARVPVVVSRHAVTDLAADIAQDLGMTMVAYCRGNRMVVLTHPERIIDACESGSEGERGSR